MLADRFVPPQAKMSSFFVSCGSTRSSLLAAASRLSPTTEQHAPTAIGRMLRIRVACDVGWTDGWIAALHHSVSPARTNESLHWATAPAITSLGAVVTLSATALLTRSHKSRPTSRPMHHSAANHASDTAGRSWPLVAR